MQYTSNSKLALYESYDQFNITGDTDSLNNNMKIIDESINNLNNNVTELDNVLNEKAGKDVATQSANGLMSSADKTKLDGIEEGANKTVVDTALSDTSTNPVQNKVVNSALNNKADKSKYGDTTINVGRKADTTVGTCSTAEGQNTTASGDHSHAEGQNTTASGVGSHAGGQNTIASGSLSFAHGDNVNANNDNEVAFGKYNKSNIDTLFSIGDGARGTERHNAFEVTSGGARVHDQVIVTTKSGFNDIRIEHGSMTFTRITSAKSYTVKFSNPFVTLLGVIVSVRDSTGSNSSYAIITDKSKTGFTVKASYSTGFEWIAIGTDTIENISIDGGEPVG